MTNCLSEPALWPLIDRDGMSPEIERHLQSCARCSSHVDELREHRRQMSAGASTPRTHSRQTGTDGRCPDRIGGYPVQRLLRFGGQAEVYLAMHPTMDREVVVKWALATISDEPRVADQFTAEATLLSKLKHPNLPTLYDLGIAVDRPFVVLEHIAGGSLAEHHERFRSPKAASILIAKVARALHAVHDFGVLHLDIQPDNILVSNDDEPRLIDFGSSLPRAASGEQRRAAATHGTPEYMAPELLAGDADRIDVACDIYGLGAVLHEMLFGGPPQPELIWASGYAGRGMTHHTSSIPPRLQVICRRALHPDPQQRYGSARQFALDLEQFAAGRRPIATTMLAGPLVLAAGLLAPFDQLWPALTGTSSRACASPQSAQRVDVIADAFGRLLHEAGPTDQALWILLADGRCLPLSVPTCVESPLEFQRHLARDVAAQPGTTLLLFSDGPLERSTSCDRQRLPDVPAGTIAQVSNTGNRVLAGDSTDAMALQAALGRVQSHLRRRCTRFTTLVVAAVPTVRSTLRSPNSDRRHDGTFGPAGKSLRNE